MIRSPLRAVVPLCLLMLGGCTPDVGSIDLGAGEPGELLSISIPVDPNSTSIQDVTAATAPAGSGQFGSSVALSWSDDVWSGEVGPFLEGSYDVRVRVGYKRLFQTAVRTVTREADVALAWEPGTFAFEDGSEGTAGWTVQGVVDASGADVTQCGPDVWPPFGRSAVGWPQAQAQTDIQPTNGSLRLFVSSVCFPASSDPDAPLWQVNFRSPDLSGIDEWQGIDGVRFRIKSQIPLQVMATVVHAGEDGTDDYASPMASGVLDFEDVAGPWVEVARTGYVPDRPIRGVLIRMFGQPMGVLGPTQEVLVDVVQPIH